MKLKKAIFIGFSVTIQTDGYFELVNKHFNGECDMWAIGGENWHSLLYAIESIPIENYEYCIFEIATCKRWLGVDVARYEKILLHILSLVHKKNIAVGFLSFTRGDIDVSNDPILNVLDLITSKYAIHNERYYLSESETKSFLFDGIHPRADGIKRYADAAIRCLLATSKNKTVEYNPSFTPQFVGVDHPSLTFSCQPSFSRFSKGGLDLSFFEIKEGQSISVGLPCSVHLMGVLLKIGPETGKLEIITQDERYIRLPYDERNYYERYLCAYKTLVAPSFTFCCHRAEDRPALLKGSEFEGVQVINIAGLLIATSKPNY
jgi:hypothetical protein